MRLGASTLITIIAWASMLACSGEPDALQPGEACSEGSCGPGARCDPDSGICVCQEGFTEHEGDCVDARRVPCKDDAPANATSIFEDVEIRWMEGDGWSEPASCDWACDSGFGEHPEHPGECLQTARVACAQDGVTAPQDASLIFDSPVTVEWDDDAGWDEPEHCAWACDPGFGEHEAHPDECRSSVEVSCGSEGAALPSNARYVSERGVVYWSDSEGWGEVEGCGWECEPGFGSREDRPDECLDAVLAPCDEESVVAPDDAEVVTGTLVILLWDDERGWSEPSACAWRCDPTFGEHASRPGECLREVEVACDASGVTAPADGHVVDEAKVTIAWDDDDGWSEPSACGWACDPAFGEHESRRGECLQEVDVACDAPGVQPPENGHVLDEEFVTIAWTDEHGWSKPSACGWACDPTFGEHESRPGECLREVEVTCDATGVTAPADGHVVDEEKVTIAWDDDDGWSEPESCPWACDPTFGEHESRPEECLEEADVTCDATGVTAPEDGHVLDAALVTIAWDDDAGWSEPGACAWACDPTFGEHESRRDECLQEVDVTCDATAVTAPEDGHVVDDAQVTIVWDDDAGWSAPAPCEWACDPGFAEHETRPDECLQEVSVACDPTGVVAPENASVIEDAWVTIEWDESQQGWSEPTCPWACDPGFGEHESLPGSCHDELVIDCRDQPPENAATTADTVTIYWEDESKDWSDDQCPWACEPCFLRTEDGCIRHLVSPGRTWPGSTEDLEVEVLGAFEPDALLVWEAGGDEQLLTPAVEADRLVLPLPAALFEGPARTIPLAVQHDGGLRCPVEDFVLGGVLPDTGQQSCFSSVHIMNCPAEGHPLYGQDAHFGWDLVMPSAWDRFDRTEGTLDEWVLFDRLTSLEWQGCDKGRYGRFCNGESEQESWQEAIDYCANLEWGGRDDWQLPTTPELLTLVNADEWNPAAYERFGLLTPIGALWSSTQASSHWNRAWIVSFVAGSSLDVHKTQTYGARCVRRGDAPAGVRLRSSPIEGEPVVRDTTTGLMWQGCPAGSGGRLCEEGALVRRPWADAIAYCTNLAWGGYSDWRLPDRNELSTIVDYDSVDPAIDAALFPGTPRTGYGFWTSTTFASSSSWDKAWRVRFSSGRLVATDYSIDKTFNGDVRCVRGGIAP